jgi:hypothetical protein
MQTGKAGSKVCARAGAAAETVAIANIAAAAQAGMRIRISSRRFRAKVVRVKKTRQTTESQAGMPHSIGAPKQTVLSEPLNSRLRARDTRAVSRRRVPQNRLA